MYELEYHDSRIEEYSINFTKVEISVS